MSIFKPKPKSKPKPEIHEFICEEYDKHDDFAVLANQDNCTIVEAYATTKLTVGKIYKGYITGSSPLSLQFIIV